MRIPWRGIATAAVPLVAMCAAAAWLGFVVPLPYEEVHDGYRVAGTHLRRGWDDWVDHGVVSTWELPTAGGHLIEQGRYRFGRKVGEWRLLDPDGQPRRIENWDEFGRQTERRTFVHGRVRTRLEREWRANDHTTEIVSFFDAQGHLVHQRTRTDSELSALDGVPVRMERSDKGVLDRAVHRGTTDDGRPLVITYLFTTTDVVHRIERAVDGVVVESREVVLPPPIDDQGDAAPSP